MHNWLREGLIMHYFFVEMLILRCFCLPHQIFKILVVFGLGVFGDELCW